MALRGCEKLVMFHCRVVAADRNNFEKLLAENFGLLVQSERERPIQHDERNVENQPGEDDDRGQEVGEWRILDQWRYNQEDRNPRADYRKRQPDLIYKEKIFHRKKGIPDGRNFL